MGIFDKLLGKPSRDKFAQWFIAALKAAGDTSDCAYDNESFRLTMSDNGEVRGHLNLHNLYDEFCGVPRADRKQCLRSLVRGALSHWKQIPDDFEDASYDLRPKIWTRASFEKLKLQQQLDGNSEADDWPIEPLGDHLVVALAYDLPEAVRSISQEDLDRWGVSHYEAMEVARRNLEAAEFTFASIGDHFYASLTGDTYDATRLLFLDLIRELDVVGDHVAMVPNRNTLLITGSKDEEGKNMMLDLAEKSLQEDPRPMIATPLKLVDDHWEDWMPSADDPQYPRFRSLAIKWLFQEYADQKELWEAIHESRGIDEFVASYSAVERPDSSELVSYCVWAKGIVTLLPKTDKIVLVRGEEDIPASGDWDDVQRIVGHLMTPLEAYPSRFRVSEFPTAEELEAIGFKEL